MCPGVLVPWSKGRCALAACAVPARLHVVSDLAVLQHLLPELPRPCCFMLQGGTEAEGGLEWALYDKITISEQAPGESGGYVMGPRTIPMPTEAGDGCTWRLVATYAGERPGFPFPQYPASLVRLTQSILPAFLAPALAGSIADRLPVSCLTFVLGTRAFYSLPAGTPEVQAPAPPPLVMATFTIGAAPPAQLLLSPGCLEALQADKWLRLQRNTAAAPLVTGRAVAFEGLAQAAVPDLVGLLADGWVTCWCHASNAPQALPSATACNVADCQCAVPRQPVVYGLVCRHSYRCPAI